MTGNDSLMIFHCVENKWKKPVGDRWLDVLRFCEALMYSILLRVWSFEGAGMLGRRCVCPKKIEGNSEFLIKDCTRDH